MLRITVVNVNEKLRKIEQALQLAEQCHQLGKLDDAFIHYNSVLAIDDNNGDAYYGIGTIQLQQHALQDAVTSLSTAVSLNPDISEFSANYGMALEASGRTEDAMNAYAKAIHLAPNDIELVARLGKRLVEKGFAKLAYRLLGELDSSIIEIALLQADAEQALGNWAGATRTLQNLVEKVPNDKRLWRALSRAAAHLRDYPLALTAFKESLEQGNSTEVDLLALADLHLQARDVIAAKDTVGQVLKINSNNSQANLLLAKCLRIEGDKKNLAAALAKTLELDPQCGEAWQLRLESEFGAAALELAGTCLSHLSEDMPPRDYTLAYLACARALENNAQYERAFECFVKGNSKHKIQLQNQDKSYDPDATDSSFSHIKEVFDSYPLEFTGEGPTPIFILGMPRSGTTLVERILNQHNAVESLGENEAMEFIAAQFYWDRDDKSASPLAELTPEYWSALRGEYWQRSLCSPGIVTDKMPHNFRHIGLILSIFRSAPIIYLKRDPRDVCLSIFARMFPDGHRYACDLQWIAHYYHQATRLMQHWQKRFPGRILQVDYEALVEDANLGCSRIFEHCGLRWDPNFLQFYQQQEASFTFSELQVRKPVNSEGIGRWRHYESQIEELLSSLRIYGEI
ncbi:MAG: tetratricopeptide repeat protein [Pseudomonadales bacterium]|nr:tetratricopeptide repeat protein [Pseudomonadales bacterium]